VGRLLRQTPPDGVVLIDYMGAMVSLGLTLRGRRLPKVVDHVLHRHPRNGAFRIGEGGSTRLSASPTIPAIFPEEARFYAERGADVDRVATPLSTRQRATPAGRGPPATAGALAAGETIAAAAARFRSQEMRYLGGPTLAAAGLNCQRQRPGLR